MATIDGKVKGIWAQQFSIVKNGLDEAEVSAFIGRLIDQNNDLANKLEHLHSLTKLAAKTVIEAEEQAKGIKIETEKKAKARATTIITRAEGEAKAKAKRITTKAEEKARAKAGRITTKAEEKARGEAERIIAEAQQRAEVSAQEKVSLAEQQAQNIIRAAEEKAEAIKTPAKEEANRIITEAKQKAETAERQAREIMRAAEGEVESAKGLAEEKAQNILKEAMERAEVEAQRIRQKAEQLLLRSKRIGEEEIRQRFERVCEELLSDSEDTEEMTAISTEEESKAPGPSGPEAAVCAQADTVAEEMQEQLSVGQEERDKKESLALYHGTVELAIPPPVALDRILKLHKHLAKTSQIKVLNLKGSADKGIRIKLLLQTHIPLLSFLEALPEVENVSAGLKEADKMYPPQHRGDEPPVRRIVVTTKR